MRRRILLLVLSTTSFALVLLGVLLVTVIWRSTEQAAEEKVADVAAQTVASLESAFRISKIPATGPAAVGYIQQQVDSIASASRTIVTVTLPRGETVASGEPEGRTWSATVEDGGITVTSEIEVAAKAAQVGGQAVIVLVIGLVALGVAMVAAWFYTRRLMRPFDDFREFIASVATGDRRRLKERYGVAEIDMVAEVLDVGVSRFDDMIERERQATQDASHQLKSPLTAISLRLEEILTTDSLDVAREEAAVALAQVERLTGVVDEVVGVMRGQRSSMPIDVAVMALVDEQVEEWTPSFRAAGREIRVSGRADVVVHAEPGAQAQVLATLLENSLAHGAGPTTVRVRRTSGWAVVEVTDQGQGIADELVDRVFDRSVSGGSSSGLGLSVARTLLAADGGRLELLSARPAVFAVFLPAVDDDVDTESATAGAGGGQPASGRTAGEGADQAEVETAASSAASTSSGNTQRR